MQQIALFLNNLPQTKANSRENQLIEDFRVQINLERYKTKYKPMTFMAVRSKLAAIANSQYELSAFFSECMDYKNRNGSFSKRFFGSLK